MARFSGRLAEEENTDSTVKKPRFSGRLAEGQEESARAWSDVPGEALRNALPSAGQLVSDTVQPILHPVETAKAVGRLAGGVAAKMGIGDFDQSTADAVGQAIVDRYGSEEAIKKTMATDPAGLLSDIAGILTGGSGLAIKAPGTVGKIARTVGKVGEWVDPITGTLKVGGAATRFAGHTASEVAALTTSSSADAIKAMQNAGREGNSAALRQLRDKDPITDINDELAAGKDALLRDRRNTYQSDMAPVNASTQQLNWKNVRSALDSADAETHYRGVTTDNDSAAALEDVRNLLNEFEGSGLNTPEAFDRFKVSLNARRQAAPEGSHQRGLIDRVAQAAGDEIKASNVGPDYNTAQRGYQSRSQAIDEAFKVLSLGDRASNDSQIRKALSILRSGVATNFGGRRAAADPILRRQKNLEGMLAGRIMSGWTPTGIYRALAGGTLAAGTGAAAALWNPVLAPAVGVGIGMSSPRLVGETAYKVGQARNIVDTATGATVLSPAQRQMVRQTALQAERIRKADERRKIKNRYPTKPE